MLYVDEYIKKYLEYTLKFAHNINKQDQLLALLYRLGHGYHNNGNQYVCFLYRDFAPYSFGFSCVDLKDCEITETFGENGKESIITKKYNVKVWLQGGLIYHGPLEDGNKAETFSVQLTEHDGWSIHT